jgi:hypothetical protein
MYTRFCAHLKWKLRDLVNVFLCETETNLSNNNNIIIIIIIIIINILLNLFLVTVIQEKS